MTLADRIAVMDRGRLVQIATPGEIYEEPNSRYVADFIGDINLLEGTIVSTGDGTTRLDCNETGATVEVGQAAAADPGSTAWFAIRPEKVRLTLDQPPEAAGRVNVLSGEVWDIAYLGDVSVFHVKLADGAIVKSSQTNVTRLVERPITWHDKVWLTWPRDAGLILTR